MSTVTFFDHLVQLMSDALAHTSAYAPAVLVLASFVEYVFPPFPGDTLVMLGAWYSVQGVLSWPVTFAAVTAGAVAGGFVDYQIGVRLGRSLDRGAARRGPLTAERLARFEAGYRRWGALFLIANRFLPGVRAFLFVAAGAARLPLGRVLLYGAISAALWNALLLVVGSVLVKNLGDLGALASRYTAAVWIVLGSALVILLARRLLRARNGSTRSRRMDP
jgi:membrane protein DedA with SNARE-associated domain